MKKPTNKAGPASVQKWKGKAQAAARAPEAPPVNARKPAGAAAPAGENDPEPAYGHSGQKFRAEPAGASGEAPKRPKFHAKSQQERVSEAKLRMEKRGGKLEKAQDRLPGKSP